VKKTVRVFNPLRPSFMQIALAIASIMARRSIVPIGCVEGSGGGGFGSIDTIRLLAYCNVRYDILRTLFARRGIYHFIV